MYCEIENHIQSHNEFKALVEKIRVANKKHGELYYAKQVAYEKLQKAQVEYDRLNEIAGSLQWEFMLSEQQKNIWLMKLMELGLI